MEMPKPGAQHAALHAFAGTWQGTERMPPSQWVPQDTTAESRVVNRLALGGFALIQDYAHSIGGAVQYEAHGVFTWDAAANEYCLYWFDSMGSSVNEFRGQVEGQTWTLVSRDARGYTRGIWVTEAPDRYRHEMATSPDGKTWTVMMEGEYRKVAD